MKATALYITQTLEYKIGTAIMKSICPNYTNNGGGGQECLANKKNNYNALIKLTLNLRLIRIKYKKQRKLYKNIISCFPELQKEIEALPAWENKIIEIGEVAQLLGIQNALAFKLGCVAEKHKAKWYQGDYYFAILLVLQELCKTQEAESLQHEINNILYNKNWNLNNNHNPINFLDSDEITIQFIKTNKQSIKTWLESSDFEQYIEANHPYPPLLNPKDINYDDMKPEIAWDLNLPLPDYYKFIVATRGVQGHYAFFKFLQRCINVLEARAFPTTKDAYITWFTQLLLHQNEKNALYFINFWESSQYDQDKLAWLCWANKEIVALVRDPISRLKSIINHNGDNPDTINHFNLTFNCDEVVKYWMWYIFGESPNIHISLTKECFLSHKWLQVDSYFTPLSNDKVMYIDMNEIIGEKTIHTMNRLGEKFDFSVPNDHIFFTAQTGGIIGYMLMGKPKILYIHEMDLEKTKNDLNSLKANDSLKIHIILLAESDMYENLININHLINIPNNFNNLILKMKKDDFENLKNNDKLFQATKQYLKSLMMSLEKRVFIEEAKKINEKQILSFLAIQQKLQILKDILDEETAHIKEVRPDIVESWQYYQEFERLCKTKGIK